MTRTWFDLWPGAMPSRGTICPQIHEQEIPLSGSHRVEGPYPELARQWPVSPWGGHVPFILIHSDGAGHRCGETTTNRGVVGGRICVWDPPFTTSTAHHLGPGPAPHLQPPLGRDTLFSPCPCASLRVLDVPAGPSLAPCP